MRSSLAIILFSSFLSTAQAMDCFQFKGYTISAELCWHEDMKAFVSKNCASMKCDAVKDVKARFPASEKYQRTNLSAMACTRAGAETIVLRDKDQNEMSFCEFEDKSLRDASSVELVLE